MWSIQSLNLSGKRTHLSLFDHIPGHIVHLSDMQPQVDFKPWAAAVRTQPLYMRRTLLKMSNTQGGATIHCWVVIHYKTSSFIR